MCYSSFYLTPQVLDQSRSICSRLSYIALLGTLARSREPAVERLVYANSMPLT
jgi:hypothetical protein